MIKEMLSKKELLAQLDGVSNELLALIEKFREETINVIPFEQSWTAAQVIDHITKSNRSIAKALLLKGTYINRLPDERVHELKSVFLNFNTKFKSPDFIIPDSGVFRKDILIANLAHSFGKLAEHADLEDLSTMINHPAFGDITKFEILYFVIVHTQRHIHQLKNIYEVISNK